MPEHGHRLAACSRKQSFDGVFRGSDPRDTSRTMHEHLMEAWRTAISSLRTSAPPQKCDAGMRMTCGSTLALTQQWHIRVTVPHQWHTYVRPKVTVKDAARRAPQSWTGQNVKPLAAVSAEHGPRGATCPEALALQSSFDLEPACRTQCRSRVKTSDISVRYTSREHPIIRAKCNTEWTSQKATKPEWMKGHRFAAAV